MPALKATHTRRCSSTTTPDHLGSSSYITNLDGEMVQHIEYVPFGEVLNTARAYKDYYKIGFHFTWKLHDIWNMGDTLSPPNSKWGYQYESTAAYGGTTFMLLSNGYNITIVIIG